MSEFLHDPPVFVVSKREWHTYFYAARRCLSWRKMFYHYRTSCIIRRHPDFDIAKVVVNSDISIVCVCVCVCNKRDVCAFEMRFLFLSNSTHQCMHQYIVQSSVTSKTTHNLSHIDTTTTIQTIANTIMSTKLTDDTLQLFIVKSPISKMSIHIAFKFDAGSTSERIEIFSSRPSFTQMATQ